jgi:hypothetical protein
MRLDTLYATGCISIGGARDQTGPYMLRQRPKKGPQILDQEFGFF